MTTAQLQAHAGQVRCGRCMQVFNALAGLAPEPAAADPVGAPESALPAAPATADAPAITTPEVIAPVIPEPEAASLPPSEAGVAGIESPRVEPQPGTVLQDSSPDSAGEHTDVEATTADRTGDDIIVDQPDTATAHEPAPPEAMLVADPRPDTDKDDSNKDGGAGDADNPFEQVPAQEMPADPRRRRFAAASILMAAVLAAQAVFFYRSEIAARYPLARQWLGSLCAGAGCTVTLPQRPQSILIEASDLQVTDPANPNRIQLTATLRNHAGHDLAYPALDLVLTNVNDHTLARRIFLPQDYLGAARDVRSGIAANAELTVRLALETGNLGAAGFRLAVLPAPVP